MSLGKGSRIAIVELGMLGGIAVAFFTLPETTPLRTFLIISAAVFILGNVLLFARIRKKDLSAAGQNEKAWPHVLKAFAILAGAWLLILLLGHL